MTEKEDSENNKFIIMKIDGKNRLLTKSFAPGIKVYNERSSHVKGHNYRVWDPFHSKLAAAIIKGLKNFPIKEGTRILYLGASTGTTVSHLSDIVGDKGVVFGVEMAPRVAREFVEKVAKHRKNVIPIIADARKPNKYHSIFGSIDLVYCDIAQPDQTQIAITNCQTYLPEGGKLLLTIKSRSIDVSKDPKAIFIEEAKRLESSRFKVIQTLYLEPFDKDHAMISAVFLK